MERAMGIEPWSEAWEARNKNLKTLELGTLSRFAKPLIWKMKAMEGHLAWRATYVGAEPTGERGLVNSSGGKAQNCLCGIFLSSCKTMTI